MHAMLQNTVRYSAAHLVPVVLGAARDQFNFGGNASLQGSRLDLLFFPLDNRLILFPPPLHDFHRRRCQADPCADLSSRPQSTRQDGLRPKRLVGPDAPPAHTGEQLRMIICGRTGSPMGLVGLNPSPKALHGAWWLDRADGRWWANPGLNNGGERKSTLLSQMSRDAWANCELRGE